MRTWGTRKDASAELGKDGQALRYKKRKSGGGCERERVTHPSQRQRRMGHPRSRVDAQASRLCHAMQQAARRRTPRNEGATLCSRRAGQAPPLRKQMLRPFATAQGEQAAGLRGKGPTLKIRAWGTRKIAKAAELGKDGQVLRYKTKDQGRQVNGCGFPAWSIEPARRFLA